MTRSGWCALVLFCLGCLERNPEYPRPDLRVSDMTSLPDLTGRPDMMPCPTYEPGGGGGKRRPEVYLAGGRGPVGETGSYKVDPFYLDVFEVTVKAYRECFNAGSCTKPAVINQYCTWTDSPISAEKELKPINCIEWKQANTFCVWTGRRLPSEVEWEFAAGGPAGMASTYPWGNDEPISGVADAGTGAQGCSLRSTAEGTCQVGQYGPTLGGVRSCGGAFDLAGDVFEWTREEYASTYMNPPNDCDFMNSSSCSIRGGSWDTVARGLRAASRSFEVPSVASVKVGARCARTP